MTPRAVPRALPAAEDVDHAPIRGAVVGLGHWGPGLVRNLDKCTAADLVVVCDRREEALAKIGRRSPPGCGRRRIWPAAERRRGRGVRDRQPVSTHHRIGTAALEAGNHVFVEKPLAGSAAVTRELDDLASERGVVHLDEPRERRPPPARRDRRVRPRIARHLRRGPPRAHAAVVRGARGSMWCGSSTRSTSSLASAGARIDLSAPPDAGRASPVAARAA